MKEKKLSLSGIVCSERDDYEIPAYDPNIPPEERSRLIEEARKELRAALKKN